MNDQMGPKAETVAQVLKNLAHPGRLLILCQLAEVKKNVTEIVEGCRLSQSQTSQYLTQLTHQGFLEKEKQGKEVYYQIIDPKLIELMKSLYQIYCSEELNEYR